MPSGVTNSTHIFHWEPNIIKFLSVRGLSCNPPYDTIHYWQCTDNIPTDSTENVRMNLWLNNPAGPSNGQNVEVIINSFESVSINKISTTIPEKFHLYQNFPNPFNPVTNIRFDISKLSPVKITIYNILGKEVTTLVNKKLKAGSYEVDWNGSDYPSGVYFYKLIADEYVDMKKMLFIK